MIIIINVDLYYCMCMYVNMDRWNVWMDGWLDAWWDGWWDGWWDECSDE